ncbi:ATP-grasp domain-containing protein [Haliangium sp.]|uniref:ATP-grasp domain-containing protein n=1 Tax=Haliangium sp. TaxID=2663208 RepID=UPI003D0F302C
MATTTSSDPLPAATRTIGLSLGADLCWPACYEEIVARLKLSIPIAGEQVDFQVERVTVEPFDLRQPCRYDVVLDRLTHWFHTSREWIKKAVILDGLYVLNNPWSLQSMEKHTSYCAMMKLGMPVPDTWLIPPKAHEPTADLQPTLDRYARNFDLGAVGEQLGFPMFMKPYDGGAWVGVTRLDDVDSLRRAYEHSGTRVMHLQRAVEPFDLFVRCIGIGPQVYIVRYDPHAPLHERYVVDFHFVDGDEWSLLTDTTLTINAFFGWEFNSCEALRSGDVFHPIDFANACPDFQVTSLHYHFPNMVKNMVRWSIFCAASKRPMRQNLDWEPFYAVAAKDLPYRERLAGYAAIARERLDHDRFVDFCDRHLGHLDEVAWEFFGTELAKSFVRAKVAALFPAHEVDRFTEHFWGLIKFWRKTEADRLGHGEPAPARQ